MAKKYKLEKEGELFRLIALRDFADVKAGDRGGLVESEENLSHEGDAWIYETAEAWGRAKVRGNAQLFGEAKMYGNAQLYGNAKMSGNAKMYGDAQLFGNAKMYGDAQLFGNAKMYGDAKMYGNAQLFGNAKMSGNAKMYGDAQLFGNAKMYGNAIAANYANMYGNARLFGDAEVGGFAKVYGNTGICGNTSASGDAEAELPGTASRHNKDKPKYSLLALDCLAPCVEVLEFGAKKYARNNWRKGMQQTAILDSLLRHIAALQSGEVLDKESGLPHIGHIQCNAMFLANPNNTKDLEEDKENDSNKCGN